MANLSEKRLTFISNVLTNLRNLNGDNMQRINDVVNQIKTIMTDQSISQTSIVSALDGKCARNTILTFFKGDADCKLSTLLMILTAVGADLRIDTERSREAIMSGDIATYRNEAAALRTACADAEAARDAIQERYSELIDKNTALTKTIEKQQEIIFKYVERMERAENALYRKDERIVELSKRLDIW